MERAHAERILLGKGWLATQTPDFRAALLAGTDLVQFDKGDFVFHAGDPPGGIYGVVAGSLAVYVMTPRSGPDLSHILHPGCWCGEGSALGAPRQILTVCAMEAAIALHLPADAARQLVRSSAEAAWRVGALGQVALQAAYANISDLLIRRVDRRVGAVLLRVTGALAEEVLAPTGDIRLTQGQLGQMANASRDLVNRTLAEFEAAGWVRLGYNRIAILDPIALADFAFARG
ncbi:Crp/Fnr family transcriptional regulator [Roseicella frigidaeris]|nr:Crp/Fnr family transcriptional regulator [Roseicella frigidaeris]